MPVLGSGLFEPGCSVLFLAAGISCAHGSDLQSVSSYRPTGSGFQLAIFSILVPQQGCATLRRQDHCPPCCLWVTGLMWCLLATSWTFFGLLGSFSSSVSLHVAADPAADPRCSWWIMEKFEDSGSATVSCCRHTSPTQQQTSQTALLKTNLPGLQSHGPAGIGHQHLHLKPRFSRKEGTCSTVSVRVAACTILNSSSTN